MSRSSDVINFQNLNKTDISQFDNYAEYFARQRFLRNVLNASRVSETGSGIFFYKSETAEGATKVKL